MGYDLSRITPFEDWQMSHPKAIKLSKLDQLISADIGKPVMVIFHQENTWYMPNVFRGRLKSFSHNEMCINKGLGCSILLEVGDHVPRKIQIYIDRELK